MNKKHHLIQQKRMKPGQVAMLSVCLVLGLLVLLSYGVLLKVNDMATLWQGMSSSNQYVYYAFMILAALGFCAFVVWYLTNTTEMSGIFKHEWVAPTAMAVLLCASALWSVFVSLGKASRAWPVLVSVMLVITALSTIVLVAGTVESNVAPWYALTGILLFGLTTVLGDAVGWNARFILANLKK
jgi:hypothetical protein